MNLQKETSQEELPPHLTYYSTRNGSLHFSYLIFLIRGLTKNINCRSYSSQYGYFTYFSSFFASARMPTTLSRPTSQGAGCLHAAPPLQGRLPPFPPGPAIGTLIIQDGMCCGLEQAIQAVEHVRLDLWSLTETRRMKTCPKTGRATT